MRARSRKQTAVRELEEETGYRAGRVEHLVTYQPMVGMVDSEHAVFIGRDPVKVGEPVEQSEADRIEWVPLASVPELIGSGKIWNSGVLIGLLGAAGSAALGGLADSAGEVVDAAALAD